MNRFFPITHIGEPVDPPEKKQVPFGWKSLAIPDHASGLFLTWDDPLTGPLQTLRFTLAIDLREARLVEACLGESGYRLGVVDIQYGCPMQTYEIHLAPNTGEAIAREGIRLRTVDGRGPLWILGGGERDLENNERLHPHLVGGKSDHVQSSLLWQESYRSLCSLDSVQLFGWVEGCVLEGLYELSRSRDPHWHEQASQTIRNHLQLFFANGEMRYVNPRSEEVVNRWNNNEHGLMVASLVKYLPDHPALASFQETIPFWEEQVRNLTRHPSTEACYTIAYPMALIGSGEELEKQQRLYKLALNTLNQHKECLARGDHLYLRCFYDSQEKIYPNWLRGIAWYMLGHARVLQQTGVEYSEESRLAAFELERVCRWIMTLQGDDGLWSCFAHQPETGTETSGSAGISGALVLTYKLGLIGEEAVTAARQCLKGLETYMSTDGLLHGVSQSNKVEIGEPLQRYGFRSYSQMGQGLAVQLAALLERLNTAP